MSFISPSTGFVSYQFGGVGFTQDSGATFIDRPINFANTDLNGYAVNITGGFTISGVVALSADSLLAYGDYAAESSILFSTNQGQNWKLIYHRSITDINQFIGFTMSDMVFPGNGNTGIAVNDKDILRSTNRGLSWTPVKQIPTTVDSRFTRLSLPTANDGYALAGDLLFKTSDGGATWNQVNLPTAGTGLNFDNVSFVSSSVGYVTRLDNDAVYKTVNGGTSWIQMNDASQFPVDAADMHFINDSTGFIATRSNFDVYKTTDNGVRWELCKGNTGYSNQNIGLMRMFFYNKDIAWAGGSNIFLMLTTNGGGKPKPAACFSFDLSGLDATSTVLLSNCSKPGYTFKWYLNNVLLTQTYNASYHHDPFKQWDTVQLVVSNGIDTDTLTKYQFFSLPPYAPSITSFTPATGSNGTLVTIYGSGFTQVNSVKFGSVKADSFIVVNDNIIRAIVAGGATGSITVADKYSGSAMPGFTYYAVSNAAAPVVSAFNPVAGPVGTTVTISGSNFNATPANNLVSFGAVNARVISSSANQIICQVPPGSSMEPVTVYNASTTLSGRSRKPFNVTFADSGLFTINSFDVSTQIDYNKNIYPFKTPFYSIGKDIDGDGKPDLVTYIDQNTDAITVYRNTTVSKFISFDKANAVSLAAAGVSKFRIEDLDGDGKADIAYNGGSGVFVSRNTSVPGNVVLAPAQQVDNASGGNDIAIADLDGDGKNDVATAAGGAVELTRNTSVPGYLSFGMPQRFASPGNPDDIAAADLDGDGKIDIVAHNATVLSCYKNTSTLHNISVATPVDFPLPTGMFNEGKSLAVTDFDLDGKLDVIVFDNLFFAVLRNTSTPGVISFDTAVTHSLDVGDGWGGCVANLSGDGKPDVLTGSLLLARNNSTPGNILTNEPVYINPHYSSSMNTADFDLDGKMDVISTSINYNSTLIYRNKMGDPIDLALCPVISWDWIDADFGGNTYQWQLDTGTGFKNMVDDAYFLNTTSYSIGLKYLPTSFNGYKLRCKIDNQYSRTFLFAFSFEWMGFGDANWENPYNWSCGVVPDKYADVVIDQGTVNVNTDVEVKSIVIKPGVKVNVTAGKHFNVVH